MYVARLVSCFKFYVHNQMILNSRHCGCTRKPVNKRFSNRTRYWRARVNTISYRYKMELSQFVDTFNYQKIYYADKSCGKHRDHVAVSWRLT